MDQLQTLTDSITNLETKFANALSRVTAENTTLQAVIDDLKAHPAAPDLSALISRLDAVSGNLDSIDPTPAPAAAEVAVTTPVVNTAPAQQPADPTPAAPADPAATAPAATPAPAAQ